MGPCAVCSKPGSHGAQHSTKVMTVWACDAHKAALPKPRDWNYDATEADDRIAAMREMARVLSASVGKEAVAALGRDAFEAAFNHGLDAYFAMRAHLLEP